MSPVRALAGWLALLLFLLPGTAMAYSQEELCAEKPAYVPINERLKPGLLFTLEKCGQPQGFLFGTIHSDASDLLDGNRLAAEMAGKADTALFELVESPELAQDTLRHMLFPPQEKGLSAVIGRPLFDQASALVRKTMPDIAPDYLDRFRPWALAVMLQYPPSTGDGIVLDARLQALARAEGVTVAALETPAEQFGFFERLSAGEQSAMLLDAVERYEDAQRMNEQLLAAYRQKDIATISSLGDSAFEGMEDQAFAEKLERFLIMDRNRKMVTRMQAHLRKGTTFIAVGVLHLPGERGLLALLEKKGYFISQMVD